MAERQAVEYAPDFYIGSGNPLVVIAGPCAIESPEICQAIAATMKTITAALGLPYVFKASFDKANRTSLQSPRGPGLDKGLEILAWIRSSVGVPVLTDVHEPWQAKPVAEVVDILQIPAFLCRQTDLLLAVANTGKTVNIKKGQFLAPEDMKPVIEKVMSTGNRRVTVTERGTSFGYHNLVVDMRGLDIMAGFGAPVIFDGTHSVQLPGGQGTCSGGQRQFVPVLARAAAAVGIDGLFLEVHPEPEHAVSDAANSLPLDSVQALLEQVKVIHESVR